MSLFTNFSLSASGLDVQRQRLEVSSENLANVDSTHSSEGGPYRKKDVVVSSVAMPFQQTFEANLKGSQVHEAQVLAVIPNPEPPKVVFDPNHPDANEQGYVALPNVNVTQELVDILNASKAYEANITAFNSTKSMILKTIDLGNA